MTALRAKLAAAFTGLVLAAGPACTHAPDRAEGYGTRAPRKLPELAEVPVRGYRARIKFDDGERLVGELLVAEPDGVVIVRTRKDGDQSRETDAIRRATIRTDPKAGAWLGGIGGATAVLIPMTLASGFYFVVTMPIVAVGGAIALGVVWAESRVVLTEGELQYLYQYARWPQGRPRTSASECTADPLSLGPMCGEQVRIGLSPGVSVAATPGAASLVDAAIAEPVEETLVTILDQSDPEWIRVASDDTTVRVSVWLTRASVLEPPPEGRFTAIVNLSPTAADASWVEVAAGTRVLDRPGGEAFAVVLRDTTLHTGGEDGRHREVSISTVFGHLRGWIECPCDYHRGAGG